MNIINFLLQNNYAIVEYLEKMGPKIVVIIAYTRTKPTSALLEVKTIYCFEGNRSCGKLVVEFDFYVESVGVEVFTT